MASAIPKQGEEIHDLAVAHDWTIRVTEEELPLDDNDNTVVTYQLVGSKGRAMFMIGWFVHPDTGRWNVSIKHAILITATSMEMKLADAMDLLPRYVYWDHMNYKHFKGWLAAEDPEGILNNWNEENDIKEKHA